MKKILFSSALLMVNAIMSFAQCSATLMAELERQQAQIIEEKLKEMDMPEVKKEFVDPNSKTYCVELSPLTETQFLFVTEGYRFTPFCKDTSSKSNYRILYCQDSETNNLLMSVVSTSPNPMQQQQKARALNPVNAKVEQINRQIARTEKALKIKRDQLKELRDLQYLLGTEMTDNFANIIVAELSNIPYLGKLIEKIGSKLQAKGIAKLSDYYDINYEPIPNENAELIESIVSPLDEALSASHFPLGKFAKYWDIIKHSPSIGKIAGDGAAKIRIFYMEKDLENEITATEARLEGLRLQRNKAISTQEEKEYFTSQL